MEKDRVNERIIEHIKRSESLRERLKRIDEETRVELTPKEEQNMKYYNIAMFVMAVSSVILLSGKILGIAFVMAIFKPIFFKGAGLFN